MNSLILEFRAAAELCKGADYNEAASFLLSHAAAMDKRCRNCGHAGGETWEIEGRPDFESDEQMWIEAILCTNCAEMLSKNRIAPQFRRKMAG